MINGHIVSLRLLQAASVGVLTGRDGRNSFFFQYFYIVFFITQDLSMTVMTR